MPKKDQNESARPNRSIRLNQSEYLLVKNFVEQLRQSDENAELALKEIKGVVIGNTDSPVKECTVEDLVRALVYSNRPAEVKPLFVWAGDPNLSNIKEQIEECFESYIHYPDEMDELSMYQTVNFFNTVPPDVNLSTHSTVLNVFINSGGIGDLCQEDEDLFCELFETKAIKGIPLPPNTYYINIVSNAAEIKEFKHLDVDTVVVYDEETDLSPVNTYAERMALTGLGQGMGADYKPWVLEGDNLDKTSGGGSSALNDRMYSVIGEDQIAWFKVLEWDEFVTDVRENYPLLPASETQKIAQKLGIKHPTVRTAFGVEPRIYITDFLVTRKGKNYAFSLCSERLLENLPDKFKVIERYWAERGVPWRILSEKDFPRTAARNYELFKRENKSPYIMNCADDETTTKIKSEILSLVNDGVIPTEICWHLDDKYELPRGSSVGIFREMLGMREIRIDMNKPLSTTGPLWLEKKKQAPLEPIFKIRKV